MYRCVLRPLHHSRMAVPPVALPHGTTVLGRGAATGVDEAKCSRAQVGRRRKPWPAAFA